MINCPRCKNIALTPHKEPKSGVSLDVCLACKGILFDAGELDLVLDVAAKDLQPPVPAERPPAVLCPKCFAPMAVFQYPQTMATIDMCPACRAIWLDRGEFEEISIVRRALRKKNVLQE